MHMINDDPIDQLVKLIGTMSLHICIAAYMKDQTSFIQLPPMMVPTAP